MASKIISTQILFARVLIKRAVICSDFIPCRFNAREYATSGNSSAGLFDKNDVFMKKYSDSVAQSSNNMRKMDTERFEDAVVVKTTGLLGKQDGKMEARLGVFWGDKDDMNVYKKVDAGGGSIVSLPLAELEAVNIALRQAIHERGLTRLIVETDSEFVINTAERWLANWKINGYMKRDGTPVKNQAYLEELDRLLSMIDVKFVRSNYKTRYDNDVINALRANPNLLDEIDSENHIFHGQAVVESVADADNVMYAFGAIKETNNNGKKFVFAGYGVHWPFKSENDTCGRFAQFPVTEFRVQMQAIIEALKLAKKHGLRKVRIVTNSDRFLRFYNQKWIKNDGNPVANFPLYKQIMTAEKNFDEVKYNYMPSKFNVKMEQAGMLAGDGLAYPIEKQ